MTPGDRLAGSEPSRPAVREARGASRSPARQQAERYQRWATADAVAIVLTSGPAAGMTALLTRPKAHL